MFYFWPLLHKQLDWDLLSEKEQVDYPDCEGCGTAKCDVVMERRVPVRYNARYTEPVCNACLYPGLSACICGCFLVAAMLRQG